MPWQPRQTSTSMSLLGHGSKGRDLPSWGHCMKEGRSQEQVAPSAASWGVTNQKGKVSQGEATDWWEHWVQGWKSAQEHHQPERYMLLLFLALYILSSFLFVFLIKLIFALPISVSSPTFFYFLSIPHSIHCIFSSIPFYFFLQAAFPVFLTLGGDTVIFLPLCPTPWLFPCVHNPEEKDWYTCFTIKVWPWDGLDRKCR